MKKIFFNQIIDQLRKGKFELIKDLSYYNRWRRSLNTDNSSVSDRMPWINFRATDILTSFLNSTHKVFEYGGGGSTLFFLDRASEVVTVEHNAEWFSILSDNIESKDKIKWHGNLILPQNGTPVINGDIADPKAYLSDDDEFSNMNFKNYVSYIDKFPDGYFDVILIDGRARPSCIQHSVQKLNRNGLLLVDNAERTYYLKSTADLLKDFKLISAVYAPLPYNELFTQTNVWQKLEK